MASRVEHNIRRVRASVSDTQGRYTLRTRALARKMAASTRDQVRRNVSSPRFPGYAISGGLARKAVASEPQKTASGWIAVVRVQLTGKQKRYALIHETGGKIPIRNPKQLRAMFASLRRHGQLGRRSGRRRARPLRYITIRAKHYFRDGVAEARRLWTLNRLKDEF